MSEWMVEMVDEGHYAIFHKEVNEEWVDEHGDNLCFETAEEAEAYLKGANDATT
jgi:hypothetical protein